MSSDNLPLRDLQKIILGKRNEPLSSIEIKNFFSYPTTPESILYLITALNRSKIDPNTTLVQAISNSRRKEDIIPIALAIRYGADPNMYVSAPNVGDIHILAYSYLALSGLSSGVLNSTIIILMASGADPNSLVFDTEAGLIKDEYSLAEPIKGHSVLEWLEDQGYSTIIPQISNQNYKSVDKTFMTMLATFLDRPGLIPKESSPRLDEVILGHSINVFDEYIDKSDPNIGLKESIKYLNLTTFEKYMDEGIYLNYGEINDLILTIDRYRKMEDYISMGQVQEILLYSLRNGQSLDEYQMDMIKKINNNALVERIEKVYYQPYWIKSCKISKGTIPSRLKILAYRLNLYPESPKDTLCRQIKLITQADPDMVKKSVINRQKARIRSDISNITEFDQGNKVPVILCNNRSLLPGDMYDYPDVDLAYYKDFQLDLWCFTSNNYLKMLDKKTNPYTNQDFPEYFLNAVKRNKDFISKYRSISEDPIPISKTIDTLSEPDKITNDFTDRQVKLFEEMASSYDVVEWNIEKLSSNDLQKILRSNFGIEVDLANLEKPHAEKTFYVLSYNQLKNNPDRVKDFFQQIKTISTVSKDENKDSDNKDIEGIGNSDNKIGDSDNKIGDSDNKNGDSDNKNGDSDNKIGDSDNKNGGSDNNRNIFSRDNDNNS